MHMSDEAGDAAILGLSIHQETLDHVAGAHARAAWLFLNDHPAFGRAEDIRYTDEHRLGRLWSAFSSTKQGKYLVTTLLSTLSRRASRSIQLRQHKSRNLRSHPPQLCR